MRNADEACNSESSFSFGLQARRQPFKTTTDKRTWTCSPAFPSTGPLPSKAYMGQGLLQPEELTGDRARSTSRLEAFKSAVRSRVGATETPVLESWASIAARQSTDSVGKRLEAGAHSARRKRREEVM